MGGRTCVFVGDSHLANVGKRRIGWLRARVRDLDVLSAAVGGWTAADLADRAQRIALLRPDVVVISVGANDASRLGPVPIPAFVAQLDRAIAAFPGCTCLALVVPPPADVASRTLEETQPYRTATLDVCERTGATPVDTWDAFGRARRDGVVVHEPDGLHLNDAGYEIVIAGLAEVLAV